jgi:GWxTD domain-containing protein
LERIIIEVRVKNMFNKSTAFKSIFILLLCVTVFLSGSCRYYKLERNLDPENADFLSKVRYIITKQERKIFLELPASERMSFREEFWKRRDTDPGTEENEFKIEYFDRIDQANEMFISEARPGWVTDRGRILILFGEPTNRIVHSGGSAGCQEIWYFGNFPVVFRDTYCTGQFVLVTYDLSSISTLNMAYMHELSAAQHRSQQTIVGEKIAFDFVWRVEKIRVDQNKVEGVAFIEIPFANIWFQQEDEDLVTTLTVEMAIRDLENKLIWEHEESFQVKITEEDLTEGVGKNYKIEIPFTLEKDLDRLRLGKNRLFILLRNETGKESLRKVAEFVLNHP